MIPNLEATIKALQGGLTQLGIAAGVKNIDSWMETLEKADFNGSKTIHEHLGKLKSELQSGTPDGAAITATLKSLGSETTKVAGQVDGEAGQKIKQLGEALSSAGK